MNPRQSTSPQQLKPGDRFKVRRGVYAGNRAEVVSSESGRYSVYKVRVKLLEPVELRIDYTEVVEVERDA